MTQTKPRLLNARHLKALPPNAKYIGRRHPKFPGLDYKWGNPYQVGAGFPTLKEVIEAHCWHMLLGPGRLLPKEELRGYDLV